VGGDLDHKIVHKKKKNLKNEGRGGWAKVHRGREHPLNPPAREPPKNPDKTNW